MPQFTEEQKAQAVALVNAGETSRTKIAKKLGCSKSTISRWVASADRAETEPEKSLAEKAGEIAETIKVRQQEIRNILLDRIGELVPETNNLQAVATAYGIVTDKALLAEGKPTTIQGQALVVGDGSPEELEATVEELRNRRLKNEPAG